MAYILISDSDEDYCLGIADLLRENGYETGYCLKVGETLDKIDERKPDGLIISCFYGAFDNPKGINLIQKLREKYKYHELPIIMIDAGMNADMAVKAIKLGAFNVLIKPLDRNELLQAVNKMVTTDLKMGRL